MIPRCIVAVIFGWNLQRMWVTSSSGWEFALWAFIVYVWFGLLFVAFSLHTMRGELKGRPYLSYTLLILDGILTWPLALRS